MDELPADERVPGLAWWEVLGSMAAASVVTTVPLLVATLCIDCWPKDGPIGGMVYSGPLVAGIATGVAVGACACAVPFGRAWRMNLTLLGACAGMLVLPAGLDWWFEYAERFRV